MITIKRLTRIGVLKAGIFLAVFYGIIALLLVPFFMIISLLGLAASGGGSSASADTAMGAGMMLVFSLLMPLLYAVIGFVSGIIVAAVYNLVARFTGGLELQFADDAPAA